MSYLSSSSLFYWDCFFFRFCMRATLICDGASASSLGMMSEEEKKLQRIEDIKELLS